MQKSITDLVFGCVVPRKSVFIRFFKLFYILQFLVFIFLARSYVVGDSFALVSYELAKKSGEAALLLFILALVPGITKRFGIRHKLIALIMIFRRYIGISMYMFVFIHAGILKLAPILAAGGILGFAPFELFGLATAIILFFLFITSNDVSVRLLGTLWYWIHKLIYIAMFTILLHVGTQRTSEWTILMGATVILMISSFLYQWIKKTT